MKKLSLSIFYTLYVCGPHHLTYFYLNYLPHIRIYSSHVSCTILITLSWFVFGVIGAFFCNKFICSQRFSIEVNDSPMVASPVWRWRAMRLSGSSVWIEIRMSIWFTVGATSEDTLKNNNTLQLNVYSIAIIIKQLTLHHGFKFKLLGKNRKKT